MSDAHHGTDDARNVGNGGSTTLLLASFLYSPTQVRATLWNDRAARRCARK
jgi:hypothetical protein